MDAHKIMSQIFILQVKNCQSEAKLNIKRSYVEATFLCQMLIKFQLICLVLIDLK